MLQRNGHLMATGRWMMDTYAVDLRIVPREPVEVNIATAPETIQLWHERLGHHDEHHVQKVLEWMEINMTVVETGGFCDGCVLGKCIRSLSLHGQINHRSMVSWSMSMLMDQSEWSRFEVQSSMCFSRTITASIAGFSSSSKRMEFPSIYAHSWMKYWVLVTE